uniref:MFS domain-containing protein n=1 Tax=Angiostrongylus cantonensis TaxID=6313 RepID=A0A158P987_ANGCA
MISQGFNPKNVTAACAQTPESDFPLQDIVEKDIASTRVYLQVVNTVPSLITAPLVGTWSDKRGLTGGVGSLFSTTLAIVTDDCRNKLRPGSSTVPLRIGIASFLQSVGALLGTLIMSFLAVPALYPSYAQQLSYVQAASLRPLLLTSVHWLGKDSLMILIGIIASAITFILISYAESTTAIFLTAGLTVFCGGIAPGYRSFLPRMVPKEQTARLLTVCSIIMAFCPMMSTAIFNSVFYMTLDWWPGFAFFVGGILQLLVVGGQGAIHVLMRPQWLAEKRLKAQINAHSLTVGVDNPDSYGAIKGMGLDDPSIVERISDTSKKVGNVIRQWWSLTTADKRPPTSPKRLVTVEQNAVFQLPIYPDDDKEPSYKGYIGRTLYTAFGLATMGAFCYPYETVDVVREGIRYWGHAWEQFQNPPQPPQKRRDK